MDDLDALRALARRCLHVRVRTQDSVLADVITDRPRANGAAQLKRGRTPRTAHGTATRAPGHSREPVYASEFRLSRPVRAIWQLPPTHIRSLLAWYSPPSPRRDEARRRLCLAVASNFTSKKVRHRAALIAALLISGRTRPREFCEALGVAESDWRRSPHRSTVTQVRACLAERDSAALQAWARAMDGTDQRAAG